MKGDQHQRARVMQSALRDIPTPQPVREAIDWDCLNRLSRFAAMRRAELGEARWAELNREFTAGDALPKEIG